MENPQPASGGAQGSPQANAGSGGSPTPAQAVREQAPLKGEAPAQSHRGATPPPAARADPPGMSQERTPSQQEGREHSQPQQSQPQHSQPQHLHLQHSQPAPTKATVEMSPSQPSDTILAAPAMPAQQHQQQQPTPAGSQQTPGPGSTPTRPVRSTAGHPPAFYSDAKPARPPKKCVECGSTETPMWRTHPKHGRGTLCNACGVKLYRQQCKDKSQQQQQQQRERPVSNSAGWGSAMSYPEDLLAAAQRLDWGQQQQQQGHKRQKTGSSLSPAAEELLLYQRQAAAAGRGSYSAATGDLHAAAAANSLLYPAMAKAMASVSAGQEPDPLVRGCQFAFRGQLPDGSMEPRAIHNVTVLLHTPREPGTSITQSHLAVLDSAGSKLATYHVVEMDPRLEYDQYLNAAVWDSREGWWLLLPTPDHAVAFQVVMRTFAARKLGLLFPPSLPEPLPPPLQQQQPLAQVQLQHQQVPMGPGGLYGSIPPPSLPQMPAYPAAMGGGGAGPTAQPPPGPMVFGGQPAYPAAMGGGGAGPAAQPPPAQFPQPVQGMHQAAALQQLAAHLGREQAAAQQGGGEQPPDVQRLMAFMTQVMGGAGPGNQPGPVGNSVGGVAGLSSWQAQTQQQQQQQQQPQQQAPAALLLQQQQQPPLGGGAGGAAGGGPAGSSALQLAHNPQLERLFAAPPHHNSADPMPAAMNVAGRSGGETKPMAAGPMPFAAHSPAANLLPGFGGAGAGGSAGPAGQQQGVAQHFAEQRPPSQGANQQARRPSPQLQQPQAPLAQPQPQLQPAPPQPAPHQPPQQEGYGGAAGPPIQQQSPWPHQQLPQRLEDATRGGPYAPNGAPQPGGPPAPPIGAPMFQQQTQLAQGQAGAQGEGSQGQPGQVPTDADAALRLLAALQERCR